MRDQIRTNLRAMWLTAAALSMTLPVFVPSFNSLNPLSNAIGAATLTMFILSFPLGLLAIPLMSVANMLFGVDLNSIGGEYLGVCSMFILGAVQWFWLAPKIWSSRSSISNESTMSADHKLLAGADAQTEFDDAGRSPLEKIIGD